MDTMINRSSHPASLSERRDFGVWMHRPPGCWPDTSSSPPDYSGIATFTADYAAEHSQTGTFCDQTWFRTENQRRQAEFQAMGPECRL
jgi:hypothetical protein